MLGRPSQSPSGGYSHCLSLPTLLLLFYPLPQYCFHFPFLSVWEDEYSGIISYERQPLYYLLTRVFLRVEMLLSSLLQQIFEPGWIINLSVSTLGLVCL